MAAIEFSKTRIVYYENGFNELKIGDTDAFKVSEFNDNNANNNIRIVEYPGSKHNWHQIPTNFWGLYCTPAEIYSLYENFDSFTPKSISVTLAHTVPTAIYPGTSNTTQLSFNNTIYTLIYELHDIDQVSVDIAFTSRENGVIFMKSFDGASAQDNKRVMLPINNVYYKIPSMWLNTDPTNQFINDPPSVQAVETNGTAATEAPPGIAQPLNVNELKAAYCPEFHQDNANIKALYPGENQNTYRFESKTDKFSKIKCTGTTFGKIWQNLDSRAFGLNTDIVMEEEDVLTIPLFPKGRGPVTRFFMGNSASAADDFLFNDIIAWAQENKTIEQLFSEAPIPILLKGLPILNSGDSLVNHTFCGTVTWCLNVEAEPRHLMIPRPLKWNHVSQKVITLAKRNGENNEYNTRTYYYKTWPTRPYRDHIYSDYEHINRLSVNFHTEINDILKAKPQEQPFFNMGEVVDGPGSDEILLNNYQPLGCVALLPTKTFLTNTPIAAIANRTRSKTKAKLIGKPNTKRSVTKKKVSISTDDEYMVIE